MTFSQDLYKGKVFLVTGGTQGIGAGICNALIALGGEVIAVGLKSTQNELSPKAQIIECDISDGAAVKDLIGGLRQVDGLINCAGIIKRGIEHDVDVFEQVIAINLTATMRLCTLCRPLLAKTKGNIVNLASMLSFFGGGLVPAYSASKGGIAQLTKSLAIAYADDGIRVNAVAPGWIATSLTKALQEDRQREDAILGRTPLKRWGTPNDVANCVAFLCSPAAAFITGIILPVDGGYLVV